MFNPLNQFFMRRRRRVRRIRRYRISRGGIRM